MNTANPTEAQRGTYDKFREGWLEKDSEVSFYECVKSEKITADCACVGFLENGVFGWQTYSYKTGSTLYPHFDNRGRLKLFARSFYDYDENGEIVVEWLEIWDDTYLTRLKKTGERYQNVYEKILGSLGASSYTVQDRKSVV